MISIAIMAIFFLAIVGGFGPIAKGIFINKAKTMGTNLAQEQVEKLKAVSYYRLLITPSPLTYPNPAVSYDDTYYPPEQILAGGVACTRLTYIQVAQEDSGTGKIITLSPSTPDTGLKLITVTVIWGGTDGNYLQVRNLVSNPEMVMSDAIFTGTITDTGTGNPIENARVNIAENAGWLYTTGSDGKYSLSVVAGNYNVVTTAQGYFSKSAYKTIDNLQTLMQDFALVKMGSATVTGLVWKKNNHVVISQVVGSSVCAATGFIQEYIELFNPTTAAFTVASGGVPEMDLIYQAEGDMVSRVLSLDYYVESIPAHSYYLIANTTTISVCGSTITADATFRITDPEYPDIIKNPDAGGFGIVPTGTTDWIDRFGWDRNNGSKQAEIYETEGLDENIGLEVDEQYVRRCSTSNVLVNGVGPCYDSGNNDKDFFRAKPMIYTPHNSSDTASIIIAGEPIEGAAVTMDDGLSSGTNTYLVGSPPYAEFVLTSVATGTWTCMISGGGYLHQISTVSITGTGTISIPNATTDPPWGVVGYSSVVLSSAAEQGYVSGTVTNAGGSVINLPNITVTDGFNSVSTDANGKYMLQTSTGTYTITANPNGINPQYVSHVKTGIVVTLGAITSGVDFRLSEGGRIEGFATRDGTNPLPDVLFVAEDSNGNIQGDAISGSDGYFMLINLSTGSYTVYPVLDSGEKATPDDDDVDIQNAGGTVFSTTFTVTGAFGRIGGYVTDGGTAIKSGVLIIVTTSTFSGTPPEPPVIDTSILAEGALYMGTSTEQGRYFIEVRGSTSTPYNIYGFYPKDAGTLIETKYYIFSSKYVTAGSTTTVNFSTWLP